MWCWRGYTPTICCICTFVRVRQTPISPAPLPAPLVDDTAGGDFDALTHDSADDVSIGRHRSNALLSLTKAALISVLAVVGLAIVAVLLHESDVSAEFMPVKPSAGDRESTIPAVCPPDAVDAVCRLGEVNAAKASELADAALAILR